MITFQRRWLEDVTMCILHTDIVSLFCNLSIFIMIFCESNSGLRSPEKIRIQWIFPYLLIWKHQIYQSILWNDWSCGFRAICFFRCSYDCFLGPFCINSHFRTLLTKRPSTLTMTGLSKKRGSGRLSRVLRVLSFQKFHTVCYASQVARDFVHQLQHHTWTQGAVLEPHQK